MAKMKQVAFNRKSVIKCLLLKQEFVHRIRV
uniref:Uncharacterized protein n=1 Tax=Arundo donax TaxID=35708 RepID=A0A0A9ARW0_ARUDO